MIDIITSFGYEPVPGMWPAFVNRIKAFQRPITVWSAGCQIGCDAYYLAMHLHEAGITTVRIIASDMDQARVETAEQAHYLATEVDTDVTTGRLPEQWRKRYFHDAGQRHVPQLDGPYPTLRIAPQIRSMVEFIGAQRVPDVVESADVIHMRNAWGHISPAERLALYRKLHHALPQDGVVAFRLAHYNEVARHMPRLDHPCLYGRPDLAAAVPMPGDVKETDIVQRAPYGQRAMQEFLLRVAHRADAALHAMRKLGLTETQIEEAVEDARGRLLQLRSTAEGTTT